MLTKKKSALVGDVTRTERAKAHLDRLSEANGKRLLVDLDATGRKALEALLKKGFGKTQKDVVIKSLVAAHKESKRKV